MNPFYIISQMLFLSTSTAHIPRDLPLELPLDESLLKALLIPLFLMHIVFVNLMVGASVLSLIYEFIGLKHRKYDKLAEKIAATITVNKSMAVVLGVAPLLVISLVYTLQFYTANSLTGHAWILIVPLVTLAFILTYIHKYTWNAWSEGKLKYLHAGVNIFSTLLFLLIPLIFLANINLMQYPDRWYDIQGFVSSLSIGNGNVFFRFIHFLGASVAVTSLFLCLWLTRSAKVIGNLPEGFTKGGIRRHFYKIAFFITMAQFIVGPTMLFILPRVGMNLLVVTAFIAGAFLAVGLLALLWYEISSSDHKIGRMWIPIFFVFQFVAYSMAIGRQFYRDQALVDHKYAVKQHTEEFENRVQTAFEKHLAGVSLDPDGKELFNTVCAVCHQPDKAVTAPSSKEIISLFRGKPDEILSWAKSPKKKRPQYPMMPTMAHLGEKRLRKIAEYMAGMTQEEVDALKPLINPNSIQTMKPEFAVNAILSHQGNSEKGKEHFTSKTCITCHVMGNIEIRKAPDLTGILLTQPKAMILDSILNPSSNFSKGYEQWSILTADGEVVSGSVSEIKEGNLIVRLNDGTLRKIPEEDVEMKKKVETSPMPKGLVDNMSPEEIADLISYLQSLNQKGAQP